MVVDAREMRSRSVIFKITDVSTHFSGFAYGDTKSMPRETIVSRGAILIFRTISPLSRRPFTFFIRFSFHFSSPSRFPSTFILVPCSFNFSSLSPFPFTLRSIFTHFFRPLSVSLLLFRFPIFPLLVI